MKILIIEDDNVFANNLKRGLEQEGYVADAVYTGVEGQQFAESVPYDLIILDLILPDKDGIEVCQSLRDGRIQSKILVLTGRDSVNEKIKGLDCGADDYLVKPADFGELCARVRSLLRREGRVILNTIDVGNLVMDTINRRVWKDQKEISLSPREYSILEYLMRHPGQIISRIMLEQRIWNTTFVIGSNLLDAFISRLRSKIDEGGQESLIETVRGSGYRLRNHEIL